MGDLIELHRHGQSMWLDNINRDLVTSDGLRRLTEAGLRGLTSNPTIFQNAIGQSSAYDDAIRDLVQADPQIDDHTLFEWLAIQDLQAAADTLYPVFKSSDGHDGFVSLEVPPSYADDADGTVEQARHLWRRLDRPNVMIKVPATLAGLSAIERLIAEGININVTLLFSVNRYEAVADAYMRGVAAAADPRRIASVASFFVSRVDTLLDPRLEQMDDPGARELMGKVAIANAKVAYQRFKDIFFGNGHFQAQRQRGAQVQRMLWGSTSTKNPHYPDLMYVEELIGPHTVNTVPPATLDAFMAHGEVRDTLEQGVEEAYRILDGLADLGIDYDEVMKELEEEGVRKFAESYDQMLMTIKDKRLAFLEQYVHS